MGKINSKGIKNISGADALISLLVTIVFVIFVVLSWQHYDDQIRESRRNKINLTGQFINDQFGAVINDNIELLFNLKRRIEITNGAYLQYWSFDAGLIIDQNPSFKFIEWIDSNMVIRKIEPVAGNEPALNLDISNVGYRRDQWIKSSLDSSINVTEWAQLTQGGNSFLVDAPVYYNGTFQGTITAGMVFNSHFDNVMAGREEYHLSLYDEKGSLFYEVGEDNISPLAGDYMYRAEIPINEDEGQVWTLEFSPNTAFFEDTVWYEGKLELILGLIISIMMGITLFLLLRSYREKKRITFINQKLKKLNVALNKEKIRAEEASRIKTEFLSNMSHEIRTPLNAILGLIDILQRQDVGEESRKYLEMMNFSSKNLLGLVNDILEIDRIESGKIELTQKDFCPLEEVRMLLDLYERSFEEKGLKLELQSNLDDGVVVVGDSLKFNQVLTNLLRNAYKFTQKGGVTLKYSEEQKGQFLLLRIQIADTGIGIPKENLEHIFERFSQVESGYKRKYEGTGLGLAITRKIVDAFGGEIEVESKLGEGSVFTISLEFPLSHRQPDRKKVQTELQQIKKRKVLIAEDNPMNVLVLSKLLEQFGIKAEVANNGVEVLEKFSEASYDLVFMDVHMPEMDGLEATRQLRSKSLDVPVVALTANITNESREEARLAGIQDYITKPFTREVIQKVLYTYLS